MGILFDYTQKRKIIHELVKAVEELSKQGDRDFKELIREAKEIAAISIEHYDCAPKGYTPLEIKLLNILQDLQTDCECIEDCPEGNADIVNIYYERLKEDETIQMALELMDKAQGKGRGTIES